MSIFSRVKKQKLNRSNFNLSFENKLSTDFDTLTPFMCQEVVPGDTFSVNTNILTRFAPLLAPIYHQVNVYTHYFFVPNRIIWDQWEDFITGGQTGQEDVYPMPYLEFGAKDSILPHSLADYLGLPLKESIDRPSLTFEPLKVSSLPFRAYHQIYNDYYRDPNLDQEWELYKGPGADNLEKMNHLHTRCWEKDYFTSALPWTQRGGDVLIPSESEVVLDDADGGLQTFSQRLPDEKSLQISGVSGHLTAQGSGIAGNIDPNGTLKAQNTSTTINDLRRATKLQQWLENNARGGARYIEQLLSHFNVRSSDARLQRAEYLGGGKTPVSISEVLQTSQTEDSSAQGNMAGHAISFGSNHAFKQKYFEEHGWIIGIVSILPRTAYQDGVNRKFLRFDKLDFYFPEFAHLGEQAIKNEEIFYNPQPSPEGPKNSDTFGYTPRYADYKNNPSEVHGDFRTNLSFWHLGRKFQDLPKLNSDFVHANTSDRIFAVEDDNTDHLYLDIYNDVKASRMMPKYGTPRL